MSAMSIVDAARDLHVEATIDVGAFGRELLLPVENIHEVQPGHQYELTRHADATMWLVDQGVI